MQAEDEDEEKTAVHFSLVSRDSRFGVSVIRESNGAYYGRVTFCCYNEPLQGGAETHHLTPRATDRGGAGLSTDIPVTVQLTDGRPVFTAATYRFTLRENVAGPKAVGTVAARDPGDTVTYSLSTEDTTRFTVDSTTGVVRYIGAGEDYEEQKNFTLEVVATDTAGLTATASVQIAVEDEEERIDELPQDVTVHSEYYVCFGNQNCRVRPDGRVACGGTKQLKHCTGPEDVEECVACMVTKSPPANPHPLGDPYDFVSCEGRTGGQFNGDIIVGVGNLLGDGVIQTSCPPDDPSACWTMR